MYILSAFQVKKLLARKNGEPTFSYPKILGNQKNLKHWSFPQLILTEDRFLFQINFCTMRRKTKEKKHLETSVLHAPPIVEAGR